MYPKEFRFHATSPGVKKTFVSDAQPIGDYDCRNCGGVDVMTIFCAYKGPYQTPGAPYLDMDNPKDKDKPIPMTSHFDPALGKWWVGVEYVYPCPVCAGHPQAAPIDFVPNTGARPKIETQIERLARDKSPRRLVHPHTGEILE